MTKTGGWTNKLTGSKGEGELKEDLSTSAWLNSLAPFTERENSVGAPGLGKAL